MSKLVNFIRTAVLKKNPILHRNTCFATTMPFYAVAKGRTPGIFMTWADCEAQVKGFSGAKFKKFDTINQAQEFIDGQGGAPPKAGNSYNADVKKHKTYSNLKRPYSTSSSSSNERKPSKPIKPKAQPKDDSFDDDYEVSDDLNTIITKQMDDIEMRLKGFTKSVDKIMKSAKPVRQTKLIDPPEPKKRRSADEFDVDSDGYVQVYTDGACSANGKNSAKAGLGVFWADGHPLNISEPVSGRATNNCGEIQAATKAIKQAIQNGVTKLSINTDSKFVINSVTKWMPGWKRKGWKLQSGEPVKNEKDFKDLDSVQHKINIKWNYVEAHRGIHGNEMADQLAKAGAAAYNK